MGQKGKGGWVGAWMEVLKNSGGAHGGASPPRVSSAVDFRDARPRSAFFSFLFFFFLSWD
jgi:hypothetical protein